MYCIACLTEQMTVPSIDPNFYLSFCKKPIPRMFFLNSGEHDECLRLPMIF